MTIDEGVGIKRTPLPKGFTASGINSGVRRYRPDLGVILSDRDAVSAAVYTQNECKAAPLTYCQALLPSRHIRAIVTNSGQANAATGVQGRDDNFRMALALSKSIGCLPHQVLTASTGVIGQRLEIEKIERALPELVERAQENAESFALAILTTDLVPKTCSVDLELSGGRVRLTGIAKGSGMIHPNMATMLGYVITDAELRPEQAHGWLKASVDRSFNMISVDGDTSTNDCVFLMANGASKVTIKSADDEALFCRALERVCQSLAQAIARDGEGATRMIEVTLRGLSDLPLSRKAARGITMSPLIKSAVHGEDPNWGRILARLGAEGVRSADLDRMTLKLQGFLLFQDGKPAAFERPKVREALRSETVRIEIQFGSGSENEVTAWGCDLSSKYVEINAEYST
jgi:glutamate N-acetyltransferase/amino-acid N-acetyltransferase